MTIERYSVTLETNGSGAATHTTPIIDGFLHSIQYVKVDYADGVDFDFVGASTSQELWDEDDVNAAKTVLPRQPTHDTTGTALTYDGSAAAVADKIPLFEAISITIGSGGDTKSGTFHIVYETP